MLSKICAATSLFVAPPATASATSSCCGLLVHVFDPTCSNVPVVLARGALVTGADGRAELVLTPVDIPAAVRKNTTAHGV